MSETRDRGPASLTRREFSLLRALLTRGGRRRLDRCRCEGVRAVRELAQNRPELLDFVVATERGAAALALPNLPLRLVSEAEFAACSDTVTPQGVVAVAAVPGDSGAPPQGDFILALDRLADPGNFGTIARTFRAVGGRTLWYTKGSIDPWGDKAVRSGLGAQFALDLRKFAGLAELAAAAAASGYTRFFYADPHRGEVCFDCPDLFDRSVLLIGGEANGASALPPHSRSVVIPMPGDYESLNAAQAATVLLLEHVRRNHNTSGKPVK